MHLIHGLEPETDSSTSDWIVQSLWPWGQSRSVRVGSFVPDLFEAYARILHPAGRGAERLSWSEIATARGADIEASSSFFDISALAPETPEWDRIAPREGSLETTELRSLASSLRSQTTTPESCFFAIWCGWAQWQGFREIADRTLERGDPGPGGAAGIAAGQYHFLFRGSLRVIEEIESGVFEDDRLQRSPNLWWPEDRAWCVATDIDQCSTYIGASRLCITAIMAVPELECVRVSADSLMDRGSGLPGWTE